MSRRSAPRAPLGVAAAACALLAALPLASAVVCVVCPVGYYHVGCDFLTGSSGAQGAAAAARCGRRSARPQPRAASSVPAPLCAPSLTRSGPRRPLRNAGSCVACAPDTLPANAAFVAAGAAKNDNSCPWQCLPGYSMTSVGALAGASCTPSVGGAAGLKAAEATPGAAMGGGMVVPATLTAGAAVAPAVAVPVPIAGGGAAGPAGAAAAAAPMAAMSMAMISTLPPPPATTEPTDVGESSDTANTR